MLQPAFHLNLHEKIKRSQATIGTYDGLHASLTCATAAGKVFIHNPHSQAAGDSQVTYLNINKQITALQAGCLNSRSGHDVLLIGTASNLHCYDVHNNKDLFFKDLTDGVNAVVVGQSADSDVPLAIAAGNCTIQGFDHAGGDKLWTVTGDNVGALALLDIDGDGQQELLVGSDDFDLRVFKGEEMVGEGAEADQFVSLCPMQLSRFGYALVNGTIGVYDRLERIWRVKSKHTVNAVVGFDLDGDGVPELVSGWSNGRVEARREDTGEVLHRDHLGCPIAALLSADYRGDGFLQLVVAGTEGEVRGYQALSDSVPAPAQDYSQQLAVIAELSQRKQELMYELAAYQNTKTASAQAGTSGNLIANTTRVDTFIAVNKETCTCDLLLRTNNECVIRGVVVFGEQIFEEESMFVCPKVLDTQLTVSLQPLKDVCVVLMIKALVGHKGSSSFHIFELEIELPKFAMYAVMDHAPQPQPESSVTFKLPGRLSSIMSYFESRFSFKPTNSAADQQEIHLKCLRDKQALSVKLASLPGQVQVTLRTDNLDAAGEVVGDLAAYLGVADLTSTADFPPAWKAFQTVLEQVQQHSATRLKLAADMADASNQVKQLLIKAEDLRLLGDMPGMRRSYKRLHDVNRDLIADHEKRATNHNDLLTCLKEVNLMIQRAAKLRVGAPKSRVVSACRAAIKSEQFSTLLRVMQQGEGYA